MTSPWCSSCCMTRQPAHFVSSVPSSTSTPALHHLVLLSFSISWIGSFTTCAIISHTNSIVANSLVNNRHPLHSSHQNHPAHILSGLFSSVAPHYHWYLWTALASVIYGSVSIWALHFLAMLAQSVDPPGAMLLQPTFTILSAFVATLFTFIALATTDRPGLLSRYLSNVFRRTGLRWPKLSTASGSLGSAAKHPSSKPLGLNVNADNNSNRASSEEPLLSLELGPLSPAPSNLSSPRYPANPQHPHIQHSSNPHGTSSRSQSTIAAAWSGLRLSTLVRATVWATAIALMHYLGIQAIDIPQGRIVLSPIHVAFSAALGFCGSTLGCLVMDLELDLSGQLLCATLMSLSVFAFHYSSVFGMQIISTPQSLNEQGHRAGVLPMDVAIIISVLAVATCLVSIGLLVYTASLSRKRMSELVNTKRQLGQLSIENETVARLAELKQNFISVASHELRTPLFSVTGYAELLARSDLNKEQASCSESAFSPMRLCFFIRSRCLEIQRWYLSNMQQACSNMQLIIANVLDFSKLERNNSESCAKPVRVNLRTMLEGIAQMTEDRSDLAGKKRAVDLIVQVAESVPDTVMIDETFFMRICMNLLSNALKFTERGLIMIDVDMDANDSEMLIVKVQDTGIGIPASFMSSLFEPYRQADSSTTRPHQGTGLGRWYLLSCLSICKQLVERLSGTIDVDSEVGRGTTFTVTLPFKTTADPSCPIGEVPPHTICLAYSEKVTEERLCAALRKAGHRTVGIHSELEIAENWFSNGEVDLVLTDASSLDSSQLLQAWVDRRGSSMGDFSEPVKEHKSHHWPTYILTSSTDLGEKFTQHSLMNAPNVVKIRRQGIIPHLIFRLSHSRYSHEIDLNVVQEQQLPPTTREESFRTMTSGSLSSLGSSVFDFEPSVNEVSESPASSPSGSHADQFEPIPAPNHSGFEGDESYLLREKDRESMKAGPRRILLVDDNPINVQLGARLLGLLGYQVDSATNGYEAVSKACGSSYDLVLMDCQMPGLDGLSATRKIREYESHFIDKQNRRPVFIIALTANVSESDQADCKESGMDGFLAKPLQMNGTSIFLIPLNFQTFILIFAFCLLFYFLLLFIDFLIAVVLKSTLHTFLG
ncbi:hypothetical protein VP01_522g3 [Puccinia sorghi]|uniref:Histidine kinase n=1 Tax=Puccinia sorghi TaxID=27349 RepID=A0A0L6UKK2_9BASI|nr:hypothetical protein VP01_522g3 [Puccinia sorghi]